MDRNTVQKGTPEENAVIQNIASLIQQLQSMAAGDAATTPEQIGGPSGGQPVQGAAFKSGEGAEGNEGEDAFDRTEDPQNDTSPEGPTARRPAMRNAQIRKGENSKPADEMEGDLLNTAGEGNNEYNEKETVTKGVQATENDGTENGDDANTVLFDDLPESTKENVKEIRKALQRIGLDVTRRAPVRKSAGVQGGEIGELRSQVAFLSSTLSEVLEGLSVTKSITPPEDTVVRKSRRPAASYDQGEDLVSVLKSLVDQAVGNRQIAEDENPWNQSSVVKKSMTEFTKGLSGISNGLWPR